MNIDVTVLNKILANQTFIRDRNPHHLGKEGNVLNYKKPIAKI